MFVQDPPRLGNQYTEDTGLRAALRRLVPPAVLAQAEPDLERWGQRVITEVSALGDEVERVKPVLHQVDGWGRRADRIVVTDAWFKLQDISAEEGLIALGYTRPYGMYSRLIQYAKLYLFHPSSSIFTCPLAMADGAARVLELSSDGELKQNAYQRLISRDPERFWTSGQWMTERTGGSDVSNTETVAVRQPDGSFRLHGYKYFTSATTSQMTLTLARVMDAVPPAMLTPQLAVSPAPAAASTAEHLNAEAAKSAAQQRQPLSLFYVETYAEGDPRCGGTLNNIRVAKLKDKLGTRGLPTAELELAGTPARLMGTPGKGVSQIASMFNITRIQNAMASVSTMRRGVAIVRDFSHRRRAFGKQLVEHPLHVATLARMETLVRGNTMFLFDVLALLGSAESNPDRARAAEDEQLLRLLTPLVKLFTAKHSVALLSECIEALGGTGYMEDATILPRLWRDTQVTPIWEGTTNILSLDLLRALMRSPDSLAAFRKRTLDRLAAVMGDRRAGDGRPLSQLQQVATALSASVDEVTTMCTQLQKQYDEAPARDLAQLMAAVYAGTTLLEHAAWPGEADASWTTAAECWVRDVVAPLQLSFGALHHRAAERALALDIDPVTGKPRGCDASRVQPLDVRPRL